MQNKPCGVSVVVFLVFGANFEAEKERKLQFFFRKIDQN